MTPFAIFSCRTGGRFGHQPIKDNIELDGLSHAKGGKELLLDTLKACTDFDSLEVITESKDSKGIRNASEWANWEEGGHSQKLKS